MNSNHLCARNTFEANRRPTRLEMGRRKTAWTEAAILRMQQEGRGSGEGATYLPWIRIQDFSSQGVSGRPYGLKTGGREHHLLSEGESDFFLLLEWDPDVVDIREQYPLKRDLTLNIAADGGIHHTCYPSTTIPCVLTVDFLTTRKSAAGPKLVAFDVKTACDLTDEVTLAKLEISRRYFAGMQIPYWIVATDSLDKWVITNLTLLRSMLPNALEHGATKMLLADLRPRMVADLQRRKGSQPLNEYCSSFDSMHALQPGTGLRVAKLLMWDRTIRFDLTVRQLETLPISSLQVSAERTPLRTVA